MKKLYHRKSDSVNDYLHKVTRFIADYCRDNGITVVVAGDIKNIRKNTNLGHEVNQKLHSLPYSRIYGMLSYKLELYGIRMVLQKEAYTSQCSPYAPKVSRKYAKRKNRIKRGLFRDERDVFNADAVGAYNILRKYLAENEIEISLPVKGLSDPEVVKAAV